ncbi:hypothetical protein MATL_G00231880 [Megalops atlanticus]|uniref:Ephrin-A4 n=1 Tax=Megalops atlanticus TaxID=7932 RepID=A0A9D3SVT9_MEGAT|nr:hypothetical protein MATL_G00231880 [Megalops atlanticus]
MSWYKLSGTVRIWKIAIVFLQLVSTALGKRHVIYWNSTNTRLMQDDFSIEVKPNDYLDIYCPHYPPGAPTSSPPETLALYLVREEDFRGCVETQGAVKRWECNHPHAPFGPVRFSEKIQRFSPFSMGFEFLPGRHYFYSSLATQDSPQLPCMKLRVTVCCQTITTRSKQETPAPHSKVSSAAKKTQLSLFLLLTPLFLLPFI